MDKWKIKKMNEWTTSMAWTNSNKITCTSDLYRCIFLKKNTGRYDNTEKKQAQYEWHDMDKNVL
jgi:hypothetical protein